MVKTKAADGTTLETMWESRWMPDQWGCSSVGRAPALQAGGHEFESHHLHESNFVSNRKVADKTHLNACIQYAECPKPCKGICKIPVMSKMLASANPVA